MRKQDILINAFDQGLRILMRVKQSDDKENPALKITEHDLSEKEKKHASGLMRIDHTGEVCAQALYFGQALAAKDLNLQQEFLNSAKEEKDHLAWCQQRLNELNSFESHFNIFWYIHSFYLGVFAGLISDKFSLGFLIQTENQVVKHIDTHLNELPKQDQKSKAILEQMRIDESQHADKAKQAGGISLPMPIRFGMQCLSKLMTSTTYYW